MPFLFLLTLAALVLLGFLYRQSSEQLAAVKDPARSAELQEQEIQQLVSRVGSHMILPSGETPMLATVTDANALAKQQSFYANVQNGDKLLVYVQSQKAVLYSPSRDIIVNVGPVIGEDAGLSEATSTAEAAAN